MSEEIKITETIDENGAIRKTFYIDVVGDVNP
jgi:hypothetical protein